MDTTSRLVRSAAALLTTSGQIRQFCDERRIPYSLDPSGVVLPTDEMRAQLQRAYCLSRLPVTPLKQRGTSTALVFESKAYVDPYGNLYYTPTANGGNVVESFHGEVCAAVCQNVGSSLQTGVSTLYIHSSLNPVYRTCYEQHLHEPIKTLIENQGIPVIMTSVEWNDMLLEFEDGHGEQTLHFWRVTAFVVDSTGNDGRYGRDGKLQHPRQKHNIITHAAPLVVHVGAAAMDQNGSWSVEGYSSANSPTFLAPVTKQAGIYWRRYSYPDVLTGTSVAAPHAGGVLTSLNKRYGAYLTREQILYAAIATCTPVRQVSAYPPQTPSPVLLQYKQNAAGLPYDDSYGGFGLINPHAADHLLGHMVALTQSNPGFITVPTEERISIEPNGSMFAARTRQGRYQYKILMPAGFALKTTIEIEFESANGIIFITSPSGTAFNMPMSWQPLNHARFGICTSHGWAGERLQGTWTVTSTTPVKRLRLNQHHFQQGDIVGRIRPSMFAQRPWPDRLADAIPLTELDSRHEISRVLNAKFTRGLTVGEQPPINGASSDIIAQLRSLPPGFSLRNRDNVFRGYMIDGESEAGRQELLANSESNAAGPADDARRLSAAKHYRNAALLYGRDDRPLQQANTLSLAAQAHLSCRYLIGDDLLNPEQAVPLLQDALAISESQQHWFHALRDAELLYTALCRTCAYYEHHDAHKLNYYASLLEGARKKARYFSFQNQGGVAHDAHRIEEGEAGFSSRERIGTDNTSQCIVIVAQDPITLKTGLAHLDNQIDITSLDNFFSQLGKNRLKIRLVGGRFQNDVRSCQNLVAVMDYLRHIDGNIISADIYGNDTGPSALVVDPATFTLEERVPAYPNGNERVSNAVLLFTPEGKPLITQFDFTQSPERMPVHMSSQMLSTFREYYLDLPEWRLEALLCDMQYQDRSMAAHALLGFRQAYHEAWTNLQQCLEHTLLWNGASPQDSAAARQALWSQSFYVGENAGEMNKPVRDWIENDLFNHGSLQKTALSGVRLTQNCYETDDTTRYFPIADYPPVRQSIGQRYQGIIPGNV